VSGANIKIADLEEGNPDRHVSMTGTPDQIQLAQFLINARLVYLFYLIDLWTCDFVCLSVCYVCLLLLLFMYICYF
jgi:hypothetical protein